MTDLLAAHQEIRRYIGELGIHTAEQGQLKSQGVRSQSRRAAIHSSTESEVRPCAPRRSVWQLWRPSL